MPVVECEGGERSARSSRGRKESGSDWALPHAWAGTVAVTGSGRAQLLVSQEDLPQQSVLAFAGLRRNGRRPGDTLAAHLAEFMVHRIAQLVDGTLHGPDTRFGLVGDGNGLQPLPPRF